MTGLLHDLGKLLILFGAEGQWDVVGDTFGQSHSFSGILTHHLTGSLSVVGCEFSDKCIYPESFANNPDSQNPKYASKYGIYKPNCGLDNVMLSWGHDEVSH